MADWIKTVDTGGTGDYTSLSAAEAAAPGAGNDIYITCYASTGVADTTQVVISGAGDYTRITGGDFPVDGIWDATKYNLTKFYGAPVLNILDPLVDLVNLQIQNTATTTYPPLGIDGNTNVDEINIIGCILNAYGQGVKLYSGGSGIVNFINTIIYDPTADSVRVGIDIISYYNSGNTYNFYDCTVYGFNGTGGIGARDADGYSTSVFKNCAVFGNADDFSGGNTIDYCASDDLDGTNAQDLNENAGGEWDAAFTNYAGGDFSVKDTGSLLYNTGTDLSGSGVTDDIIGTARPQATTYDIGAFEYVAAGGSVISLLVDYLGGDCSRMGNMR